ncbi:MAG: sigma-54-dependent Fis family transcriptional regulator, partial [bacterium]|nr:sigma-54-dependent Fis family transcriptional regulator [bacterium]
GAQVPETVDVRVVSATDADLEVAIAAGEFRSPLLHRLSSYEIILPPLRELREDFGRLFFHFLRQEMTAVGDAERLRDPGPEGSPWVPAELVARLAAYEWPGNVRQLRNVVRQLAVASRGCSEMQVVARVEDLLKRTTPRPEGPGPDIREADGGGEEAPVRETEDDAVRPAPYRSPKEVSEAELLAALRAQRWNKSLAARELNVSRTTIHALADACPQVRRASDLSREEIEQCAERCDGDVDAMADQLGVSRRALLLRMKELGLR